MGIRVCPDCGGKVSTSRKECIHCGYVFPATKICPDCEESVDIGAKECPICGCIFEADAEKQTQNVVVKEEDTPQPVTIAPIVPVVVPVATESVQTMQQPTNTAPIDETISVVCPQCGSTDIALQSSDLGKCKHCGTTVVLPKKEQQVNIVNNFVVSNSKEDSAKYYTIKRERTLRDEFVRGAYIDLTSDPKTPVDVSNGEFDIVQDNNEQYLKVDTTSNLTYSASVGYDYQVQYTEVDSNGNKHTKTKTETKWEPYSGSLIKDLDIYVGNDEHSVRPIEFGLILENTDMNSIVPGYGTTSDVAPLPPKQDSVEQAKKISLSLVEDEAKKTLPGDRYSDFHASGSATVKGISSYSAPTQDALFKYNDESHYCTAFAFGPFALGGDAPDDSNSIHKTIEKKTKPFFITLLALAGFNLLMLIIACTCYLNEQHLVATSIPIWVMFAMVIATIVIKNLLYKKVINKLQHEKVARTSERLEALNLAPMTEQEIERATRTRSESSLTKKRHILHIITYSICAVMIVVCTLCSLIVVPNLQYDLGNPVVIETPDTPGNTTEEMLCLDCGSSNVKIEGLNDYNYLQCRDCQSKSYICPECDAMGTITGYAYDHCTSCKAEIIICPNCLRNKHTQIDGFFGSCSYCNYNFTYCPDCNWLDTIQQQGDKAVCYNCNASHDRCVDCGALDSFEDEQCTKCGYTKLCHHQYDNDCDADCNKCGENRAVYDHIYTNACDASCDECGYVREIEHTYTNNCDESCNACGATRTVNHIYTNNCDISCNECGATRTAPHTFATILTQGDSTHYYACADCSAKKDETAHVYHNDCDTNCNECNATRTIIHTYTNNCDESCNVCGDTRSAPHTFADTLTQGESTHYYACNDCSAKKDEEPHIYDNDCDTSCNVCEKVRTEGVHVYTNTCDINCNECGETRTITHTYTNDCDDSCNVCGVTRTAPHTYATTLTQGASTHYYACSGCSSRKDEEPHSYDNNCDTTCNVCGKTRTVGNHVYTDNCDESCNVCGDIRTAPHSYDNVCDPDCNVCGATRTTLHAYDNFCDTDCNECGATRIAPHTFADTLTQGETTHYYACVDCTVRKDEESHAYNNSCDTTCNVCGYVREIEHTYSADCDTTCNVCSFEREAFGEHLFDNACDTTCNCCGATRTVGEHQYDNACDVDCNECGKTRTVGNHVDDNNDIICDICGGVADINLTFALNSDGESYTIADANTNLSGNITIPSTYIGKPITTIGLEAFKGCTSLASITIPNSVTTIGNSAFSGCSSLTGVIFGENGQLTTIGEDAFYSCTRLISITIPDSVTTIGSSAFRGCSSLTSITIPNSVTTIGNSAFSGCSSLTGVIFGENSQLTTIGEDAFYSCTRLISITIPDSVTTIGSSAFRGCSSLTGVIFGENSQLTTIGEYAFSGCSSLTSIVIPDSVTTINSYAFYGCDSLTSVTFGENSQLTTIGSYAFCNCDSLTSITIPDSVITIGKYAFYNCSSLASITIPNSVTTIGSSAFHNCSSLTSIIIPDSVTSIGSYAFYNCSSLTSITIPYVGSTKDGAANTHFGYIFGALSYSSNSSYVPTSLKTVNITGGTTIGSSAFRGCSSLTSITIPDSVTTIGDYAFYNCSSLASITIPNSVTTIGSSAFAYCNALAEVYNYSSLNITKGNSNYGFVAYYAKYVFNIPSEATVEQGEDGFVYGVIGKEKTLVGYVGTETELVIHDSVTSIGSSAFDGCSSLTSITIPSSVTGIGSGVFSGCSSLESITIPFVGAKAGVTSSDTYQYPFGYIFGTSSYTNGTAITQNYYGSSTSSTTSTTYYIPSSLRSVTVTGGNILYGAFYNCSMLTSITLGDDVTTIGSSAFYNCSSLTNITIPDSVTTIGYRAFFSCYILTRIIFGENSQLTTIDQQAFYHCERLTSITIPDSVTTIGSSAFSSCPKLTDVYYTGTEEQWSAISIASGNTNLTNATRYYYSEDESTTSGNYWHYVDGIPTKW